MKSTVLGMTQEILSSLSSDEVNSIGDTAESMQVANILKTTFDNIVARGDFGEHSQLFQLNSSLSQSVPVLMSRPDDISRIDWIKYYNADFGAFDDIPTHGINTDIIPNISVSTGQITTSSSTAIGNAVLSFSPTPSWIVPGMSVKDLTNTNAIPIGTLVLSVTQFSVTLNTNIASPGVKKGDIISFSPLNPPQFYEYVTMLPLVQFIDMINTFNPDDNDVVPYYFQGFNFRYKNDKKPQFCTVVQDLYVLFDSLDYQFDTTLQSSKTLCFGQLLPTFTLSDNFIPNLDDKQVPLLVNEAKAWAWYELKQMPHQKAEMEQKRQWTVAQKNRSVYGKPTYFEALPDFGRRSWGASWSPYVYKSSRRFTYDQ